MNKDNDRQLSAARWKQQLEVRRDGLCNSLTTASKDNMVLEISDEQHDQNQATN